MSSPLAHIWTDSFTRVYTIWGKQVILRALENREVEEINTLVARQASENQMQALSMLRVATSLVSVDGLAFTDAEGTRPLSLQEKLEEMRGWDDVLTERVDARVRHLCAEYADLIDGVTEKN